MKKLVLTMMVALMATVSVCAQKVRRPDTYNFNRAMELVENGELDEGLKYLKAELKENRIAIMLSQIKPHFIYNTLGTIERMCLKEPEKAFQFVIRFYLAFLTSSTGDILCFLSY